MAKKIKFEFWKSPLVFSKTPNGIHVHGTGWYQTTNTFGKAKGRTKCPCCMHTIDFYIWSFAGGGKRCPTCNALNSFNGAYIDEKEFTPEAKEKFLNKNEVI